MSLRLTKVVKYMYSKFKYSNVCVTLCYTVMVANMKFIKMYVCMFVRLEWILFEYIFTK
jgi:hypothetical protein